MWTNLFLTWYAGTNLTIAGGAENLFDEGYVDHLTGFNRVPGGAVAVGQRMFGAGRNLFARLQYQW